MWGRNVCSAYTHAFLPCYNDPMTSLRLGVNIDHVATHFLSWPAGVRATQLGVGRDSQRIKYRPQMIEFSAVSPGWPAFAGHDALVDIQETGAQ